MNKFQNRIFKNLSLGFCHSFVIGVLSFVILAGCGAQQDVSFARSLTARLIKGLYSARPMVDWASLQILGKDVGAEYSSLGNDAEKADYERAFIESFKSGFRQQGKGAGFNAFFNWRMYGQQNPRVSVVAANCHDKTKVFFFFIKHVKGARKLVGIQLLDVFNQEIFDAYEREQKNASKL